MARARAVIVLVAALLAAPAARAEDCVRPAEVALRDADLGAPRAPCVERRVYTRLRALALIDVPDFYGTLDAAAAIGVRWPVGPVEGSAELRAVDWRFAQNASLAASEVGVGPLTAGVLLPLGDGLAAATRVTLPFTDSTRDVPAGAAEIALHAATRPRPSLTVHGTLAGVGWLATPSDGGATGRLSTALSTGIAWTPARWIELLAGVEAQIGWYDLGLDHALARGGVRLVWRCHAFDLLAATPLAGDERTDLVLVVGWSLAR